ncbi:hypothetical protein Csa_012585 [Cucumis sativus]|uniref:Uncharacterized protein n=1 Tax=Cucumis sativus TaxID=3659 RepID=A0A0A0L5Y9_CUCSA|nr:hypothetical protein Csa_012585 [Cucumis sativus]
MKAPHSDCQKEPKKGDSQHYGRAPSAETKTESGEAITNTNTNTITITITITITVAVGVPSVVVVNLIGFDDGRKSEW